MCVNGGRSGIEAWGKVRNADGKLQYAYEVDGRGNFLLQYDDANMPSLLGIPLIGYRYYDVEAYANTRARILSKKNPYYYQGALPPSITQVLS